MARPIKRGAIPFRGRATDQHLTNMAAASVDRPLRPIRLRDQFFLGALSSSCAVVFSNPLETAKTRMQLQGELCVGANAGKSSRVYRNSIHALFRIGKEEGVKGLQRGLGSAFAYQVAVNGTRLGLFEVMTPWIATSIGAVNPDGRPHAAVSAVSGAVAGAIGAFVSSPIYLVKVRLQSASDAVSVGLTQHRYAGLCHGLASVVRQSGWRALWTGAVAQISRVAVVSVAQLGVFSSAKSFFIKRFGVSKGMSSDVLASCVSGALATVAMSPVDLVATRLCNNNSGVVYKGMLDCVAKTVRAEGFLGLYKGVTATYFRLAPHATLTFVFWGVFKRAYDDYRQ